MTAPGGGVTGSCSANTTDPTSERVATAGLGDGFGRVRVRQLFANSANEATLTAVYKGQG